MSGLFGCWHRDGRPVDAAVVRQCLSQLAPADPTALTCRIDGALALGSAVPAAPQHARRADGQPALLDRLPCVFDGRLDNRASLLRLLKDHPAAEAHSPDAVLIAAAYDRLGDAFLRFVAGDFAIALFDRRKRRLLLARDRLGVRPLCYARTGATLLVASGARPLLAYPGMRAAPDEPTLADFVLYFTAADSLSRTFFRDIRSLPPGHLLVATPERVEVRRYFDFDTTRELRLGDVGEYAEALDERITAAVRSRIRSDAPVAIAVSGGLDSSYLFCTALRLHREDPALCPAILGVSYGGPPGTPSDESQYVDTIERQYRARIARLGEEPGFVQEAAEEVWSGESPQVDRLARQGTQVRRAMRDAGARRVLTGHWGDQLLCDSSYLLDLLQPSQWSLLRRHARQWRLGPRELAGGLFRAAIFSRLPSRMQSWARAGSRRAGAWQAPWFTPGFRRVLRERFAAERPRARPGTHHARAMYQQARLPYHVQCMEWNVRVAAGHGLDAAFPFLDDELIQFLVSIPGAVQSCDGVPRGLMREAMRGVVPDAIVARRDKGEFTHLGKQSLERDFPAIRRLLGPGAVSVEMGYLDGPVVWKRLDEWRAAMHEARDAVIASRLTDLCGLELFLRRFFAGQASELAVETVAAC
jgi:asparagine synthase (glutamine-hydrolysing)